MDGRALRHIHRLRVVRHRQHCSGQCHSHHHARDLWCANNHRGHCRKPAYSSRGLGRRKKHSQGVRFLGAVHGTLLCHGVHIHPQCQRQLRMARHKVDCRIRLFPTSRQWRFRGHVSDVGSPAYHAVFSPTSRAWVPHPSWPPRPAHATP